MKFFFLMLTLTTTLHARAIQSDKAVVTCKFAYEGEISFHLDLSLKKAQEVAKDPDNTLSYGKFWGWTIESHTEQGNHKQVDQFFIGKKGLSDDIHLLSLSGNNNDDTSYQMMISYQNPCANDLNDSRECVKRPIPVSITLLTYGDDGVENMGVEQAKNCKMILE